MTSKINHEVRKLLGLSVLEYTILDLAHTHFKGDATKEILADAVDRPESVIELILTRLQSKDLLSVGVRSGKAQVTKTWKDAVRPVPKDYKPNPFVSIIKDAVLKDMDDYQWSVTDAQQAILLSIKLSNSFKIKNKREPIFEELEESFKVFIDNLPEFWKTKWDLFKINTHFNSILRDIRASHAKRAKEKVGIGSDHHKAVVQQLADRHIARNQRESGVEPASNNSGSNTAIVSTGRKSVAELLAEKHQGKSK